jgi:hypothetical protein
MAMVSLSCTENGGPGPQKNSTVNTSIANTKDNPYCHISDIPLPGGFIRQAADPGSFGEYLRQTALKKDKTVYLFNGQAKYNQSAQFAVLNIDVGNKDLQQCADAVMRLRAEYFFAKKAFDAISFYDNNKTAYHFLPPYTREHFTNYLSTVFGMCGSASLSKQLKPVTNFSAIQSGDVLIKGGFPGHAVIVMDMAKNAAGEKIYLLAQSYMPAQDIHILRNPTDEQLSPWFLADDNSRVQTPEYTFYTSELKRW